MEEYFAGIYLIPRSQHTQQRRGCTLIPAVHQKEHLWMKQSAQYRRQQTIKERTAHKGNESSCRNRGGSDITPKIGRH